MKKNDIDRLKEICEKEGFEIIADSGDIAHDLITFILREKKDPWDGVEFAKCTVNGFPQGTNGYLTFGKIYKVIKIKDSFISLINDKEYEGTVYINDMTPSTENDMTPSTETEYVDQLKKECFERFGGIREGDRFERGWAYEHWMNQAIIDSTKRGFSYNKENDQFSFNGTVLYESGKWATKMPERVEVEFIDHWVSNKFNRFDFNVSKELKSSEEIGKYIAKQLEKYLNDEK